MCESVLYSEIKTNIDSTGMYDEIADWWIERLHELTTDKVVNVRI